MNKNKDILSLFNTKFETLLRSSFVKYVKKNGIQLSWNLLKDKKRKDHKAPGEKSIDGFILNLRFFIQNNEPISLNNIEKIYEKLKYDDLLKNIKDYRKTLNNYLDTPFPIIINDNCLTNRGILEGYVYTQKAHSSKKPKHKSFLNCYESTNKITKKLIENQFYMICINIITICKQIYIVNIDALKRIK
jgi:hypothetical protein